MVQVGLIRVWEVFLSRVEKAKATMEWAGSNVYVDFDPRTDFEEEESDANGLSTLPESVSRALGIDLTKEVFSK